MSRQNLLSQLKVYKAHHPQETDTASKLIEFVELHADCFERSLLIGHITSSAWVVNKTGTRALLTHHKKLGRWLQLGGHTDGDTDTFQSALREVEEESGLSSLKLARHGIFDVDIHAIPARRNEPEHFHYDIRYAFQTEGSEDYVVSEESHDLAWVQITNLATYTEEESILRMARKWTKAS
ncbi:MAG: NUDIX hydrolase [Verrucomicrobiota bacterium]